jgi:serine/threonine-protein kinase
MALDSGPVQEREQRLDELIARYVESSERDEAPDRHRLLAEHPDLAHELRAFFADQDGFDSLMGPLRRTTCHRATPPAVGGAAPPAGSVFGGYELLGEVARGGMGVVYKARQPRLNRVVALKMIQAGRLASREEVERFRLEAEAVALLDHPNIVPIYEVGEVEGWNYFSMKLIEGDNLARHLGGYERRPRDAARLLLVVARAVGYAHQCGVLHRDLKPANILIDQQGQPHVTDFGLAKLLARDGKAGEGALTGTGVVVGTPCYMAPEQAAGTRVLTTAADVYSLGAVLYELLTGRPPFKAETPLLTLFDAIGREPERPRAGRPWIDRDLETICLKCLEKEPGRRYGSANDLAAELERYLSGASIQAQPARGVEQFWRWCRRQPALAGMTALLVMVVAAALALTTWLWRRAEASAAEARQHQAEADASLHDAHEVVQKFCIGLSEDRLSRLPGAQPIQKELLEEGLRYIEDFLRRGGDGPALRAERARARFLAASLTNTIGSKAEALAGFRRALAEYRELLNDAPDDVNLRTKVAHTLNRIGDLESTLGEPTAEATYREALALLEGLCRDRPDDLGLENDRAAVCNNLGGLHRRAGRMDDAREWLGESIAIRERLIGQHPSLAELRGELALTCISLGQLHGATGRRDDALKCYERARKMQAEVVRLRPDRESFRRELAQTLRILAGEQCTDRRYEESLKTLESARELVEALARANPQVTSYRVELALLHRQAGHAHRGAGRPDEAIAAYERSRKIMEALADGQPAMAAYRNDMAACLFDMGTVHGSNGRPDEAIKCYRKSRELREPIVREQPDALNYRADLAMTLHNLAIHLWNGGRRDEGADAAAQSLEHRRLLFARAAEVSDYRRGLNGSLRLLADMRRKQGRVEEAVALTRERLTLWPNHAEEYCNAAAELADAARRADAGLLRKLEDEAMDVLRRAVAFGFKDGKRLRSDPAFAGLRQRDDFKKILDEVP